ncbi:uncharacterized protein LOC134698897 [Mytilus trossulus]|uniref:uncharacterized protein LOC134698897 n=1 Tax=Mytilus trossulus TaxID=6551 RepID=UPI003007956B
MSGEGNQSEQPSVGKTDSEKKESTLADSSSTDLNVEGDQNDKSGLVAIEDEAITNNREGNRTSDKLVNVDESESEVDNQNKEELKPDNIDSNTDSESNQGKQKEADSKPDTGESVAGLKNPVIEKRTEDPQSSADNEDEQPVKGCSEKQNSLHQNSDNSKGFVDSETVRRIVKEELIKDKKAKEELNKDKKVKGELNKDKKSLTKMQTGFISFTAFFLGGGLMSYWWTPHYHDYTNTTYVLSDNITQSSIVMEDVTQKLLQCQANLTQIKQDFSYVHEGFTVLKNEVTDVSNGITGTIENAKEEMKEDYLLLKRDIKILTGTQQIHGNKYITYSETIFFLIAGLILEPLIIFLLYKYLPWRSTTSNHDPDAPVRDGPSAQPQAETELYNRRNTPRRTNILDKICSGNLEESICILSFYEETQDMHRSMLTSALQHKDFPMKPFLLQLADPDALSIPRCRFVFVFVDFNERNVILETPGQDLGDKKVVTVRACQKMGADVFVIYTRDRDSSHLGDGKLYNKDLSAFTKHDLLKELTAKNRGLSVNDTFSSYQKSHIRRIVLKK